jgi:hypothetical protein
MHIEKVRRWQWMLIALAVGFTLSLVRQKYSGDVLGTYGNTMNSPLQFETSLIHEERGVRYFKDLIVYPEFIPTGKSKKPVHIIAGKYYSGRPERDGDAFVAKWRPYCYIADVPYIPTPQHLAQLGKLVGRDVSKEFKFGPNSTVLDYLAMMKQVRNVEFKYAWWAEPRNSMILWVGSSFVVIGLIWPSIVYLLAFGQLTQPPQEKGVDLSKVVATPTESSAPKTSMPTEEDMDELRAMQAKLEADLASRGEEAAPAPAEAAVAVAAGPKQLTATHLEVNQTGEHHDDKQFGAGADDFYPTERKVAKPHEHP